MRLRLRLTLSFLLMAIISFAFLVFQANLIFTRQLKVMNDSTEQVLETVNRGTIDQAEVAQLLRINQVNNDQALESIRFGVIGITSVFFVVMVGMGIWLAIKYSTPFERIAESAGHLLMSLQRKSSKEHTLDSINAETFEDGLQNSAQKLKKEESVIAHTLDYASVFVKEELSNLNKELGKLRDENKLLSDQLALVNESSQLLETKTTSEERSSYGDITRQAWDELARNRSEWGYYSDEKGIFKAEGEWHSWMVQAVQQGQVVVWQDDDFSIASVPIRVRDYTLGVLDFRKAGDSDWTSDELILVQTLTDQLGQALESARLYQNTQVRAERERVLTDITSKVRASTNVDVILQTAIRELAEALRVPKGSIQLRSSAGEIKDRRYPPTSRGQANA